MFLTDMIPGVFSCFGVIATSTAILIAAGVAGIGMGVQAHQTRKAMKTAKGTAEQQQRMVQQSQDALVAKEAKAQADIQSAQATSEAQAKEKVIKKKKAIARSRTIYTSPLGIGGEAEVIRKTLLGA